jgi:hypothetical protein
MERAMAFVTIKQARAMRRRMAKAGYSLTIADRDGNYLETERR